MNVGIITYHSAYNFGSVLQALATQISVKKSGHHAKIINYRMKSQRDFYSFYRKKYGLKTLAKDILLTPHNRERQTRNERFEKIISNMNLTEEYVEAGDVAKCVDSFDCFISGSDQIWNKHSCELTPVGWEYMDPFLLAFTNKKKISYASSIASMTEDEIEKIIPFIRNFDHISFREEVSAKKIAEILGKRIETVLDPTLLLDKNEWVNLLSLKRFENGENFILYYSLAGYKDVKGYISRLEEIAKKTNMVIYAITPFISFIDSKFVKHIYNAGPVEFLQYIMNASLVVTDSYHGTLFSINFNKPFYSITDGTLSHIRKNEILKKLKLVDRIAQDAKDVMLREEGTDDIQYTLIEALRKQSIDYLYNAIDN